MTTLATIGYEGASLPSFIGTLHAAGVKQVIDVRDVPVSRRSGFSKNVLASALKQEDIEYLHLKALGDPKAGREAAREGRFETFKAIYIEHLSSSIAQDALQTAVAYAKRYTSALLCYERAQEGCHRLIVAKSMVEMFPFKLRHLGVQKSLCSGVSRKGVGGLHGTIAISSS